MTERNLCKESGCQAACCRNIHGWVASSKQWFLSAFPQAQLASSMVDLYDKIEKQEHGVYYFIGSNSCLHFSISGPCPNLIDNNCSIHDSRFYPSFCKNLGYGTNECLVSPIKQSQLSETFV